MDLTAYKLDINSHEVMYFEKKISMIIVEFLYAFVMYVSVFILCNFKKR